MATATRIQPPPAPVDPVIHLELSPQEAHDLRTLLSCISGPPVGSVRETLTEGTYANPSVLGALKALGVGECERYRLDGLALPSSSRW